MLAQIKLCQRVQVLGGKRSALFTHNDMTSDDELHRAAAIEIFKMRRRRENILPPDEIGEAAWDMLLFAFQATAEAPVQSKQLILSASVPTTTAKRWLDHLEHVGLLGRVQHPTRIDRRIVHYELTEVGRAKVRRALEAMLRD